MEDYQLDIVVEGSGGVLDPPDAAPFHTRRGDDPHRDDHRSAAGPLRPGDPARLLRRRGPGGDRAPGRRDPRRRHRPRRRGRSPAAAGGRRASPIVSSGGCATSPRSEQRGASMSASPVTAWRCSASTSSVWTRSTVPCSAAIRRQFGGGPVGLSTLAISVGEQAETHRGRVRAVPHPAWPHRPHPAGDAYRRGTTSAPARRQPLRPHQRVVRRNRLTSLRRAGWPRGRRPSSPTTIARRLVVELRRLGVFERAAGMLDVDREPGLPVIAPLTASTCSIGVWVGVAEVEQRRARDLLHELQHFGHVRAVVTTQTDGPSCPATAQASVPPRQ